MYIRRPYKYRYICYSCVTGQAVWVYQGQSRKAMKRKYYRTVASERKRKRQWAKVIMTRRDNLQRLLDECRAELPILGTLTKDQREAIKTLQQMIDNPPEFSSPFLDHDKERRHQNYLEKRRRRYWADPEYRKANKERLRERRRMKREQKAAEQEAQKAAESNQQQTTDNDSENQDNRDYDK